MKTVFALLLLCVLLIGPQAWADETNGVMMVVKGDIKVTSAKDGKTESAKIGRKVFAGDSITAGADSRAKIVMSDKNILNISPDSKVVIEKYSNDAKSDSRSVELKVEYGKVRATVEQKYDGEKNKFNIKTPTAVAGVRGTDFITGFNRSTRQSSVITFSGTVAVGAPGPGGRIMNPVFVQPGQQTNVGEGKAPEVPKAMPKEELNQMNNDSNASAANAPAQDSRQPASVSNEPKKEDAPPADAKPAAPAAEPKKDDSAKKDSSGDRAPASAAPASGSSQAAPATTAPTMSGPPAMGPALINASDLPGGGGTMPIPTTTINNSAPRQPSSTPFPTPPIIRNTGPTKTTIQINR